MSIHRDDRTHRWMDTEMMVMGKKDRMLPVTVGDLR